MSNADQLVARLADVNTSKELVRGRPTRSPVAKWIDEAKALPVRVEY